MWTLKRNVASQSLRKKPRLVTFSSPKSHLGLDQLENYLAEDFEISRTTLEEVHRNEKGLPRTRAYYWPTIL